MHNMCLFIIIMLDIISLQLVNEDLPFVKTVFDTKKVISKHFWTVSIKKFPMNTS